MGTTHLYVWAVFVYSVFGVAMSSTLSDEENSRQFYPPCGKDKAVSEIIADAMRVESEIDCARLCMENASCSGFNYNADGRICELTSWFIPEKHQCHILQERTGFKYYCFVSAFLILFSRRIVHTYSCFCSNFHITHISLIFISSLKKMTMLSFKHCLSFFNEVYG